MPSLDSFLNGVKGDAKILIRDEFRGFLTDAKGAKRKIVRETGEKVERWLQMRLNGELTNDELEALLHARDRVVRQELNTLEIQARARLQKIVFGLLNTVLDKMIGTML
jgi:hypothetical protein